MTIPAQSNAQDMAAMRRGQFLGADEDFRLTLAADGTYGLIAYRDSFSGLTFASAVTVEDGVYSARYADKVTADSPEGIVRAFARAKHDFGRASIVVRGVDESYDFEI